MFQKQPSDLDRPIGNAVERAAHLGIDACLIVMDRELALVERIQAERKRLGQGMEGTGMWWTAYVSGIVTVRDECIKLKQKIDEGPKDEQARGTKDASTRDDNSGGSTEHL